MQRPFPLEGITVVDLGQIYNGPYCTFLMAMAGARVIKIEPREGEHLRRRSTVGGAALPFAMLNSNKQFVTLNLKSPRGKELFIEMTRRADVVVENFAPGVMEKLGLGYDVLSKENPQLVYASGSGYGRSGPYRDYPAMDLTVQAMAGVMSVTGFADRPPVKAGPALCDFLGGIHLYAGLMTALYERARTGFGRLVEVSMQEAVYASLSSNLGLFYGTGGDVPPRTGNRHGGLAEAPYNVYPTMDGYIAIICVGEVQWQALLKAIGREDLSRDPRFHTLASRVANIDAVDDVVSGFTSTFKKQDLFDLLLKHRVPCAPVRDLCEVVNDRHMHERGGLETVDHPLYGRVVLPNSPLRFEGTPMMPLEPSGTLGQDNNEIYSEWLGLSADEIVSLTRDEVI